MKFRKLEEIVIDDLNTDINCSNFMPSQTASLDELVSTYDSVLEKHAPIQSKTITLRPNTEWHASELRTAKTERRKAEPKMRKIKLEVHKQLYKEQCIKTHKLLLKCRTDYYSDKILEIGCDQKKLLNLTNKLMGNTKTIVLPSRECDKDISKRFGDYFLNENETIMRHLSSEGDSSLNGNDAFCADVMFDGQALTVVLASASRQFDRPCYLLLVIAPNGLSSDADLANPSADERCSILILSVETLHFLAGALSGRQFLPLNEGNAS
ncbi:Hypothetical predicted protein [Mytilus galloprovincialis]|uniref:Uncharacterized protein n=1 Tax=Mytilus galloprovincialis TaxID=29158 RepID=A0A8B6HGY5_MYTGA|nr:Hypothetical predicted protein [Mytilus galloprovincialis]